MAKSKSILHKHLSFFRIIEIALLLIILLSVPITIYLSQQKQDVRQHASEITYYQRTIDFDDYPKAEGDLDGQYPQGIADWGKDVWFVTKPWGPFMTKSLEFANKGIHLGKVHFQAPVKVISLQAYNGGGATPSHVTIICKGNPDVTFRVMTEKEADLNTGWVNTCQDVAIAVSNGWNTSIDNIVIGIPTTAGGTNPTSIPITQPPTTGGTVVPTKAVPSPTRVVPTAIPNPTTPPPVSTGGTWKPALNTSWQWQLSTPVDTSLNVQMYDIDGFDNAASVVSTLHSQGKKVVCYMDVGSYENFRSDQASFPASVLGSTNGWPGEKWLDIRQINTLAPIMEARLDMCKSKGFDAVEPDNVDGYTNKTGFPLTAQDQLTYNTWIANQVHARGMSVALKNDVDQVAQLAPYFDWALNEQCFQYNECGGYTNAFINAGKAVFEVEYKLTTDQFCSQANALNFNALKKDLNLTTTRTACR